MARTPKVVEDRREQIIDAAMRIFAQKGFARATNKDVAQEAGITPGLIYHYFENKEALLMAVIEGRSPLTFEQRTLIYCSGRTKSCSTHIRLSRRISGNTNAVRNTTTCRHCAKYSNDIW